MRTQEKICDLKMELKQERVLVRMTSKSSRGRWVRENVINLFRKDFIEPPFYLIISILN